MRKFFLLTMRFFFVLHVIADLFVPRENLEIAQQRADSFQSMLAAELGEPVVVELDIIPIDLITIRSASPGAEASSEK